jgi:hypothetical protein
MIPAQIRERLDVLTREMQREFPRFRVVRKADSRLMRVAAWLVQLWCPCFMTGMATVFRDVVYLPDNLSEATRYEILRHERQHMRDSRRYWWFYPTPYYSPLS